MGQQQILLVVLTTMIIGIATIVAINIYNNAVKEAHQDEIIQQMYRFVGDASAYKIRPAALGGGSGSFLGFQPANTESFRGHIGNQENSPNTGGKATIGDVNYFIEIWPEGGYPQRIKITASSLKYGEGNHWRNAVNARIIAYFDKDGKLINDSTRQGFMIEGDW